MGVLESVVRWGRTDDYERPFECLRCGTYLEVVYHTCPQCGSFSIDRRSVRV
jgi:predicted RNA-binding Zn-ribbon protein involved in translation (DUF1610 family)